MATITTPVINRIYKLTEFDLLRTSITEGNMYMCTDSYKLYYDQTNSERVTYEYTGVKTINDLQHNITPSYGVTYYCWEDNSLWVWLNKLIVLWSDYTYPSAYIYDNWVDNKGDIRGIYRYDQPGAPADDNGLLKDGSVVVRDRNRLIKGKIYVDDNNDNLVISSFLGGGVRLLPNGLNDSYAELYLNDDPEEYSYIRSQFRILNNEVYVDYTEKPEEDNNEYKTNEHKYKLLHTGNTKYISTYTTTIGDGESTSFTIEHNLDTENVIVQCRNVDTKAEVVLPNVITDENTVTITTSETLGVDEISVTILGIK